MYDLNVVQREAHYCMEIHMAVVLLIIHKYFNISIDNQNMSFLYSINGMSICLDDAYRYK